MAIATVELGRITPARRAVVARRRRVAARRRVLARRRLVAALVLVAVVGLIAVAWASRSEASAPAATQTVVVAPGDTLWDIAAPLAAPGESVHVLVAEIAEANAVDAGALRPGTVLHVPLR